MTSRGGVGDCENGECGGCGKCKKRKRNCSVSVPGHSSAAFSRSSSSCSYSSIRFHSKKKIRIYYLKAQLLPQNCRCIGPTAQCPNIITPSFSTIPNINLPSGYGTAKLVITYDPVSKLGNLKFEVQFAKLYTMGNQTFNPLREITIRGPTRICSIPANITVNCLAIYLLATGGETPDGSITGGIVINRDKVQQYLHGLMYLRLATLMFQQTQSGDLSGVFCVKREERRSRS